MAINLTDLIDLDGLRAFKDKNDEARAAAITEAQTKHDRRFVDYGGSSLHPEPGMIVASDPSDAISGTGTADDPYIVDFTVVHVDSNGENPKYFRNTSSAESTASVASTSDIEALFD